MKSEQGITSRLKDLSLPARGVWIEIHGYDQTRRNGPSLPARGVWIEMSAQAWKWKTNAVTPHEGSVD